MIINTRQNCGQISYSLAQQFPELLISDSAYSLIQESLGSRDNYLYHIPRDLINHYIIPYVDADTTSKLELAPRKTQDTPLNTRKIYWTKVAAKTQMVLVGIGLITGIAGVANVAIGTFMAISGLTLPLFCGVAFAAVGVLTFAAGCYLNKKVLENIQSIASENITNEAISEFKNDLTILKDLDVSDADHDIQTKKISYYLKVADQFFIKYQNSPLLRSHIFLKDTYETDKFCYAHELSHGSISTQLTAFARLQNKFSNCHANTTKESVINFVANDIKKHIFNEA